MADATANYVYTIGGYAALAGVGYAIYHVSTQKKRAAIQAKSGKSAQPETRKEDRKKKQRMESFTSENQESSEKASKSKSYAKAAEPSAAQNTTPAANTKDDGVDNAEFAKQLSKAKHGKQFATGSDNSNKKQKAKSVKQSRANNIDAPAQEKPSAQSASSTNDADADDDQSATQSPVAQPADASGVADMLEPATAAPSVLRLTETEPKDKKKKAAKAAEPAETKKQRQNRKKAEAAKAAREESEKERKVLEEKQRRAARVGEGRAAKDGSQYTNAAAAKSAWKQGAPNGNKTEDAPSSSSHGLLDTVDDEVKAEPAAKKEAPQTKPASTTQSSGWTSSLPTEEEQINMLKEDDEWSTVKSKASKKSGRKETATSSGDDAPAKAPTPAPAAPKAQQPTPAASKPKGPQSFGSFSALTSKDEPAEEVEEEWEV